MAAPVGAGRTAGGTASDNVEHIKLVPFDAGTAQGAAVLGNHLDVTSYRAISIYDVGDPVNPELLSTTPIGFAEQNEDITRLASSLFAPVSCRLTASSGTGENTHRLNAVVRGKGGWAIEPRLRRGPRWPTSFNRVPGWTKGRSPNARLRPM